MALKDSYKSNLLLYITFECYVKEKEKKSEKGKSLDLIKRDKMPFMAFSLRTTDFKKISSEST